MTTHCSVCGVEKNDETFNPSQRVSLCRKCCYQKNKHKKQTPEYKRAASCQGKRYREKNWAKMLSRYCKSRSPDASITEDDILRKFSDQGGRCYWFGVLLEPIAEARDPFKPSLDRLDVDGPYSNDNVVISSLCANLGRQRSSVDRFNEFIQGFQLNV